MIRCDVSASGAAIIFLVSTVLWAAGILQSVNAEPLQLFDEITGYRIARYRAPVDPSVPGGSRVWAGDIDALVATENAVLLDVMPAEGAGPDPATGEWRLSKPHAHLPGSAWLPDAGKGKLDAAFETYVKSNMHRLTGGDKARAIIVYCQADCWMSWNAVKRLAEYGYTRLYWFAEGIDGWRDYDRDIVPAVPVPVQALADEKKRNGLTPLPGSGSE